VYFLLNQFKKAWSSIKKLNLFGTHVLVWLSIVASPPLWSLWTSEEAIIKVAPLECQLNEYCFMVSNVGNRSAVLTDIYQYNKSKPGVMGVMANNQRNKVIKPNDVFIITSKISGDTPPMLPYELHKGIDGKPIRKNCKARFHFIQHFAEEHYTEIDFVCFDSSFHAPK